MKEGTQKLHRSIECVESLMSVLWEGTQCREFCGSRPKRDPEARIGSGTRAHSTSIAQTTVKPLLAHHHIDPEHAPFWFGILAPLVRDPALEEDVIVGHAGACDDGWWSRASKAHHIAAAAVHHWLPDLVSSVVKLDSSKLLIAGPPCGRRRRSRPGVAAVSPSSVATPAATTTAST